MSEQTTPTVAELCAAFLGTGEVVSFVATGRSMEPTIRDGETIVVAPVRPVDLRRGDVIVYRSERGVRAHRVRALLVGASGEPVAVCRGDNAWSDDAPVPFGAVLGRVVLVHRDGRGEPVGTGWYRWIRAIRRVRRVVARSIGVQGILSARTCRAWAGARRFQ